jgi:hypothetical protein
VQSSRQPACFDNLRGEALPRAASRNLPGIVAVRDSKNPGGPVLVVTTDEWASFLTRLHDTTRRG